MMFRANTPESPKSKASSPPPSQPSSPKKMPLSVPNVANIFIKMRHSKEQATSHCFDSCSGDPQTHPSLTGDGVTCARKVPMIQSDVFICIGAVNTSTLLRASRASLMETAELAGANCLVAEQWTCTIREPKNRSNGTFRVQIRYSASATRSERPDPHKPVALDQAKSVPGLMTILQRNE